MEIIDVSEKVGFAAQFMPRVLRVRPEYKVPLICMEPGQEIAPHQSGTGIFYILSGKGVMTVDGKEVAVRAGNMVFIDKGEGRGVRAPARPAALAGCLA